MFVCVFWLQLLIFTWIAFCSLVVLVRVVSANCPSLGSLVSCSVKVIAKSLCWFGLSVICWFG